MCFYAVNLSFCAWHQQPVPPLFTELASGVEQDVGKFCSAEKGDVWLTLDGV